MEKKNVVLVLLFIIIGVMANVSSSSTKYVFNMVSSGFISQPLDKYLDKYITLSSDYKLGDATYETKGWNGDYNGDGY